MIDQILNDPQATMLTGVTLGELAGGGVYLLCMRLLSRYDRWKDRLVEQARHRLNVDAMTKRLDDASVDADWQPIKLDLSRELHRVAAIEATGKR